MTAVKLAFSVLATTLMLVIDAVQLCMFIHAILSWVAPTGGEVGPFRGFINAVTDIVTYPVRLFLERFEWARRSPLDLSFFITFLLLSLLSTILTVL
jgi:uncharacterized protein YggT (Ycf19 family)